MTIDFDRVRHEYTCVSVIGRYLTDLNKKGPRYWALCPFHDDTHADNFNIYVAKDSIERWRCFACGEAGDVVDFVARIEQCTKPEAVERITGQSLPAVGDFKRPKLKKNATPSWVPIVPVPDDAPEYQPELTFNPNSNKLVNYAHFMTRLDPYLDAEGKLMFYVIRRDFPDGEKVTPCISYCKGPKGEMKWCARRIDPPFPLMGLDSLAKYPNKYVTLVSGEKCKMESDIHSPALVNVTWLGGDNAVDKTDWTPLIGRHVTYFGDWDESGRRAAKVAFNTIEKNGTG